MNATFDWHVFEQDAIQRVRDGVREEFGGELVLQFITLTSFDSVVG
jgi:hypothetical protein